MIIVYEFGVLKLIGDCFRQSYEMNAESKAGMKRKIMVDEKEENGLCREGKRMTAERKENHIKTQ